MQYEACKEALELLDSTLDAQGRKLQVHKVYLPPNLFLSQEEASEMVVRLNLDDPHLTADVHHILELNLYTLSPRMGPYKQEVVPKV
jgi:agmatine/peptidylarginine deiminase